MKTRFIPTIVGLSIGLMSLAAVSASAGGSHGGVGHAGFSSGARGYSGTGISRGAGSYGTRYYSSGISTGHYGNYGGHGQRYYAPRSSTAGQIYGSSARSQGRAASKQFAPAPSRSGSYYVPRDQSATGPTGLGRDRMQPTGNDSTLKQRKDCVAGKAERLDTPTQNVITRNTGVIVITTTMTGGVTIATLSFLLGEVFGVGLTAGGIRPGATIRIIPTMIIMVPSMATMDFNPTRSLPTFRQRCSNWDIMNTQLTECWDRQLKQPLRITSATTGFPSREQSINQQ
jgi:hypothetical protein